MLDGLRQHSGGFGAKILLALLVLSFAIWGIGDMVRHPGRNQAVATVGDRTISIHRYQMTLKRESENLRRALGNNFSPEILKNLGLPQQVLRSMVQQELFVLEADRLGLIPGDADVVRRIRSTPGFQDSHGNFDKGIFENNLRASGATEKQYVEQVREEMASTLLADTLTTTIAVPTAAMESVLNAREEQRLASYYIIGGSLVGTIPQPDAKQIEEYYKAHAREFSAPEYRSVSYVTFKNDDVRAKATLSEEELKQAYKERQDEFRTPERRMVDQLLYSNEGQAKKAYDLLKSGTDFKQVAKSTDILNKDAVSLGVIEPGHIVESAEDAVFSLKAGEFTAPVQSPFGWHIFRVSKIDPPSLAPFEQARPTLEKDMKQQAADNALSKLTNSLEDSLAAGTSLKDAAKELGLKVSSVGPFTQRSTAPDGSAVKLPDLLKFSETAFKTDEKSDSPVINAKGGTYYLLHVDDVTPERTRSLDEVKSQVIAGWLADERSKRLSELSQQIAEKFVKQDERNAVIAKYNLQPASAEPIRRASKTAGDLALPEDLVSEIFARKIGDSTGAFAIKNGNYVIAVVRSVVPAQLDKSKKDAQMGAIHKELESTMQNEIMGEYLNHLARRYSVTIHEDVLQALAGAGE